MLEGKNILIVEDEPLIALDLETAIQDARGQVIGAMGSVRTALQAVETLTFDGAILDLRLNGEDALPVMQALSNRKIPFVIHSGQADRTVTTDWPMTPIVGKPALAETVVARLADLIAGR